MVDYAYEDLKDALEAIVRVNAIPEAYICAERFGWHELFPGCIYREEIWMDITVAREIINRAKKDDIYDGDMPGDDATVVQEAQNLVEMAEQAWAKHIRGPEVESILKLAAGGQNGGEPEGDAEEATDEHAPPETEEEDDRPRLVTDNSGKLAKSEPWEGYADDTVKNITEGIQYFTDENPDEIIPILQHVWAFETAHKNRARILTFVSEKFEEHGGFVETEEVERESGEPSEAEAEDTSTESVEAESEDESSAEGADESSDAEAESESEIGAESGEGHSDEAESDGEDRGGGSDGGPTAYQKLIQKVESELRRERLDVPQPPQEKAPELPWTWHEIPDSELQDLHMRYSVLANYKSYRLALHDRIAQHAKEAADAIHGERMVNISKYDEKGKEKKVGLIEAEIAMDSHVKRWRVIQRKHEQLAAADKRELDAYYKVVEALSRLETMRHNAWERARR